MTTAVEQLSFRPTTASGTALITGSVKRAFGDWAGDVINVKNFGAVGNGIANDTAAVQAAFDAACGPYSAPFSISGAQSKAVYFPAGGYLVVPTVGPTVVTGCVANGSGGCRLTVGSTTGYTTGDMVYVRNVGGVAPLLNGFGCSVVVVDGTHLDLFAFNSIGLPVFSGTYTRGGTICKAAIQVKGAYGISIFGAGKGNTALACATTGCTTLAFNGIYKCVVRDMAIISDRGICVDLNDTGGTGVTSQGSSFYNIDFGGGGAPWPDYCVAHGFGYIMGSETAYFHCTVGIGAVAGLFWANGNALSGLVFGGNFAGNQAYGFCTATAASPTVITRTGGHSFSPGNAVKFSVDPEFVSSPGTLPSGLISEATYYITEDAFFVSGYPSFHLSSSRSLAQAGTADVNSGTAGTANFGVSLQSGPAISIGAGACPFIHGAAFQNYHGPDIVIGSEANDAYSISGCRSESMIFVDSPTVVPIAFEGCSMTSYYGGPDGYAFFVKGSGTWSLNGCRSAGGHAINNNGGRVIINASTFDSDVISSGYLPSNPGYAAYLEINPKGTSIVTTATYSLTGADPANKMQFNSGSAQTITVSSNATQKWGAGTVIEVQQTGAGKVTFAAAGGVTIRSPTSGTQKLSLNGQYACGQLRCDATDVWTLSGDIVV